MIEEEQARLMIYQHVVQLTIAGESVEEAILIAYSVAAEAFDDERHDLNMRSAKDRLAQRDGRTGKKDRPRSSADKTDKGHEAAPI